MEIFKLEELRLQFSRLIAAVAALQRRSGAEHRWDGCCMCKSGAEREDVEDCESVHGWLVCNTRQYTFSKSGEVDRVKGLW